ncbi:putative regulator of chromosome condensation 1/beta-lactamase-inhibitor protein II [Plasmopara halstedii]
MSKNSHDDVPNLWTCARSSEATPILARLLRDEAPPDDRNDYGETALHVAASHGNDKAVILLLQYGADIMGADWESGWTPLHRSLYHQHLSTSLLLLRHAQMRFGRKFLRKYLYETIDHSQQSPLQLLSTRLQRESKHVSNTANSHNGGLVYTFGKRDYQLGYHLPNADMQVTPRLVNIPASSPITQVSASKYHTIALNAAGECFVWGFGKGGRLGTGNEFDCIEPTRLTSLETTPIKKVAAGENHTMALSRTGQVFSWGSNSFGQLGYSEKNTLIHSRLTPKRVDALRYQVVAEIAASGCHSAAIDANDGALYTWGSNRRGQLGRKERCGTDQTDATPRSVDALCLRHSMCVVYGDYDSIRAEKIALSDWHTIVVLRCAHNGRSLGQVWQFGYGSYRPSRVNITSAVSTIVTGSVMCDTWIPTCKQRDLDILDVSCAQNHSIALSACGSVFTWGHNAPALSHQSSNISRNKCAHLSRNGVPPIPSPSAPQKVLLATYGPVTSVCAFQDHCAVVTQQGDLVTWGCGQQGVLGHGRDNTWQPKPKRVKGVKKAVAVAAGHQHMAVLVAPLHPEFSTITDDTSCCQGVVPSLVTLVESKIAAYVDIMNCASVWHHAERYAAVRLSRYCVEYMQYNWDAVLDSVGRDRMELLYDLMLPPVQDLNLEEKSLSVEVVEKPGKKKRSAKRPTKEIKNEPTPLIATSKEPPTVCQQLVTVASLESISIKSSSTSNKATRHRKSRNSKFVPLESFLSSKTLEVSLRCDASSPWHLTDTSTPTHPKVTCQDISKSDSASALLEAFPSPAISFHKTNFDDSFPRQCHQSIDRHSSARPRPTTSSPSEPEKHIFRSDGAECKQVTAFSLDDFLKKSNSQRNRSKRATSAALAWSSQLTDNSHWKTEIKNSRKTFEEIQKEEEAAAVHERETKAHLGGTVGHFQQSNSTINSWGFYQTPEHVSLADVQKLQAEHEFVEQQRRILADIEREQAVKAQAGDTILSKVTDSKKGSRNNRKGKKVNAGTGEGKPAVLTCCTNGSVESQSRRNKQKKAKERKAARKAAGEKFAGDAIADLNGKKSRTQRHVKLLPDVA